MEIEGKVAVVTGAAMGIGRASALALAGAGAKVVVADIDEPAGQETVDLVEKLGAKATFVATDVSDPAQVARMFQEAERLHGGVDILHNNAGQMSGEPPWPYTSVERIHQVVSVNLLGVLYGTRLCVEFMARRGGGAIVNTGSAAGLGPLPNDAIYAATKAGIINFTQSCAALKESHRIRVNAVLPGMVDTSMILKTGDGQKPAAWLAPALVGRARLQPEEVAGVVLGLVRDEQKAGQTVQVTSPR